MSEKAHINDPPPPYPGSGYSGGMPPQQQAPPPAYPQQVYTSQPPMNPTYAPPMMATSTTAYGPMPPGATTTTVIVTPGIRYLGPYPVNMQCPKCYQQVVTDVNYTAGGMAFLMCVVIALVGGWIGCCLIPFCIPGLQDAEHRCPNCKNHLGVYRRL